MGISRCVAAGRRAAAPCVARQRVERRRFACFVQTHLFGLSGRLDLNGLFRPIGRLSLIALTALLGLLLACLPAAAQPNTAEAASKPYRLNANYDVVPTDPGGNRNVVLLTFDDGPKSAEVLDQLLNVLQRHEAKAIFFVNGSHVQKQPELLKRIAERGHTVGNHTWDHPDLTRIEPEEAIRQIERTQHIVEQTIGVRPVFFRPPYGSFNAEVSRLAAEQHLRLMTWSNGSEDWLPSNRKPERLINRVLQQLRPGSNILMHELPWTAEALDELLAQLKKRGYSFVDPALLDATPVV